MLLLSILRVPNPMHDILSSMISTDLTQHEARLKENSSGLDKMLKLLIIHHVHKYNMPNISFKRTERRTARRIQRSESPQITHPLPYLAHLHLLLQLLHQDAFAPSKTRCAHNSPCLPPCWPWRRWSPSPGEGPSGSVGPNGPNRSQKSFGGVC